jgi:hypothetical protein
MNIEQFIIKVLKKTADALHIAYNNNKEQKGNSYEFDDSCRLVFPIRSDEENSLRVSEQELRFEFVNQLLKEDEENKYWYSIETPTLLKYKGFSEGDPEQSNDGRSAAFDLVLFNSQGERIALIEFKANNRKPSDYAKDILKLTEEAHKKNKKEGKKIKGFLIELLESEDSRTLKSIRDRKLNNNLKNRNSININANINYYCIVLEENKTYMYNANENNFKELK